MRTIRVNKDTAPRLVFALAATVAIAALFYLSKLPSPLDALEFHRTAPSTAPLQLTIALDNSRRHIDFTIENRSDSPLIIGAGYLGFTAYCRRRAQRPLSISLDVEAMELAPYELAQMLTVPPHQSVKQTVGVGLWSVKSIVKGDVVFGRLLPLRLGYFSDRARRVAAPLDKFFLSVPVESMPVTVQ